MHAQLVCALSVSVCVLSPVRFFENSWTPARHAPLSTGFSRQECWRGLPFLSPGDLSDPGIKPVSLVFPTLADGFVTTSTTWRDMVQGSTSLLLGGEDHLE